MIKSSRRPVSKHKSARRFRKDVHKTHPANMKMRGWMRGGVRL